MELHVPIKSIVPIALQIRAVCRNQKKNKEKAYWDYNFKCGTLGFFSAFQSLDSTYLEG